MNEDRDFSKKNNRKAFKKKKGKNIVIADLNRH